MGIRRHPSVTDHADLSSREWTRDRKFVPNKRYGQNVDLDLVEVCDDECWTYVAYDRDKPCKNCGRLSAHADCIVIAVVGACWNNGTPNAKAAAGVFVGHESRYNDSFILNVPNPTNQIAELRAGVRGLEQALVIKSQGLEDGDLQQVVIKADSEYLVKGMTEWVFKWEMNGYRTSRGVAVANASLFKKLQELVAELNERKVEVLFWHVPRERNKQADMWANMALHNGWNE
ncbi:Ribonuclease H [Metarhizium anisopliae]|nr:Ribonuclease H [Metarhizium anisopliae]